MFGLGSLRGSKIRLIGVGVLRGWACPHGVILVDFIEIDDEHLRMKRVWYVSKCPILRQVKWLAGVTSLGSSRSRIQGHIMPHLSDMMPTHCNTSLHA